jgi:putative phage-type endonuclease
MKQSLSIVQNNHLVVPPRQKPALRLVKTNTLSREDWLDVRRGGIGSSDAAAAVGMNPYCSPLELWVDKTGRGGALKQNDPEDDSAPTYWGTLLEPIVAAHYTKRTGHRVRRINAVLQHPEHSFMRANIDREVMHTPDVQILECKTAGINGARLWQDGVPGYVRLQVQHQLAVTGKQAADVAVLLGGQHLEIHRMIRDESLIDWLIEAERQFWHYVETDTPPPVDGSASSQAALQALYPQDRGTRCDFRHDTRLCTTFGDWLQTRERIKALDGIESLLRQQLQQAMGEASYADFEQGAVRWTKSKDGTVLDVERLLADQPDLLTHYSRPRSGVRRFTPILKKEHHHA